MAADSKLLLALGKDERETQQLVIAKRFLTDYRREDALRLFSEMGEHFYSGPRAACVPFVAAFMRLREDEPLAAAAQACLVAWFEKAFRSRDEHSSLMYVRDNVLKFLAKCQPYWGRGFVRQLTEVDVGSTQRAVWCALAEDLQDGGWAREKLLKAALPSADIVQEHAAAHHDALFGVGAMPTRSYLETAMALLEPRPDLAEAMVQALILAGPDADRHRTLINLVPMGQAVVPLLNTTCYLAYEVGLNWYEIREAVLVVCKRFGGVPDPFFK